MSPLASVAPVEVLEASPEGLVLQDAPGASEARAAAVPPGASEARVSSPVAPVEVLEDSPEGLVLHDAPGAAEARVRAQSVADLLGSAYTYPADPAVPGEPSVADPTGYRAAGEAELAKLAAVWGEANPFIGFLREVHLRTVARVESSPEGIAAWQALALDAHAGHWQQLGAEKCSAPAETSLTIQQGRRVDSLERAYKRLHRATAETETELDEKAGAVCGEIRPELIMELLALP